MNLPWTPVMIDICLHSLCRFGCCTIMFITLPWSFFNYTFVIIAGAMIVAATISNNTCVTYAGIACIACIVPNFGFTVYPIDITRPITVRITGVVSNYWMTMIATLATSLKSFTFFTITTAITYYWEPALCWYPTIIATKYTLIITTITTILSYGYITTPPSSVITVPNTTIAATSFNNCIAINFSYIFTWPTLLAACRIYKYSVAPSLYHCSQMIIQS